MAVDGHGCAMIIADYIAFGVLVVLALSAIARLYVQGKFMIGRGAGAPGRSAAERPTQTLALLGFL
jgi:hypothetical protein